MFKYLLLSSIFFFLVGCSFEPDKREVAIAVKNSIDQDFSSLVGNEFGGLVIGVAGIESINVELVDKIGCQPNGKNAYLCEVVVEFNILTKQESFARLFGVSGKQQAIKTYRLVKTSRGWVALGLL